MTAPYNSLVSGRDIPWLLNYWATKTPSKVFLIWAPVSGDGISRLADKQFTYAEFELAIRQVAAGLASRGVEKQQRVLIHLDNCPELLIAWFACGYLGATAVLTNTRSTQSEMDYFVAHTEPVAVITQPGFSSLFASKASKLKIISLTKTNAGEPGEASDLGELENLVRFDDLYEDLPMDYRFDPDPQLDLSIQFTSGTTSRPKAVVWTHGNMVFAAQQGARNYRLHNQDVCHLFLPLFHMYALSPTLMSSLWVGSTVLLQRRFSVSNFWSPAIHYRASWCAQIPFTCKALEKKPIPIHHFRFWTTAIAWPEMEHRFGVRTVGCWGMTETVACPIVTDIDHGASYQCLGRVTPGYDIAIKHTDGSVCESGECGRLYLRGIKGVTIFKEYLNDPQANQESFDDDGWFDTGDLVRIDDSGDLYFEGREKDMIKVGGENVSPLEVEAVVMEAGWVKECAVVGQNHSMLEEVPVVFIIPSDKAPSNLEASLIEHCREKLADFKVIRRVYCLDEFPRSVNYKIAKSELRKNLPVL